MAARSLNRVQLIGNLTRDPELRYTPQGTAVCSFGLATNRAWNTDTGERREETEFHRIVAWNKLAELCSQLCAKGRKVYVEGRLATRTWTGQDGQQRTTTEIVIDDMILLDSKRPDVVTKVEEPEHVEGQELKPEREEAAVEDRGKKKSPTSSAKGGLRGASKKEESIQEGDKGEEINPDEIPF